MDLIDFHPGSDSLTTSWNVITAMSIAFTSAQPHRGYDLLVEALFPLESPTATPGDSDGGGAEKKRAFALTSNVDGFFERAGWPAEALFETHGCVAYLQCTTFGGGAPCPHAHLVWRWADEAAPTFAETKARFLARGAGLELGDLPRCPCGALARPNVSHTTDHDGDVCGARKGGQREAALGWIAAERKRRSRLVVVEVGCGTTAHSLRRDAELVVARHARAGGQAHLVRIDLNDASVPAGQIGLKLTALDALVRLFPSSAPPFGAPDRTSAADASGELTRRKPPSVSTSEGGEPDLTERAGLSKVTAPEPPLTGEGSSAPATIAY
jgi:hypothetical protein